MRGPFALAGSLVVLGCTLAVAPANAEPITLRDARGEQIAVERAPERIVSLLPSLTETVCALGACAALVGVDAYSNWPEPVKALPRLGGLGETQIEALYRLRPDVVLVSPASRIIDRLRGLGLTVLAWQPVTLADARESISAIGTLLDRRAAADELLARIDQGIARAASRLPAQWRDAQVYFEVSPAPFAAGEASFVGELLSRLGLANIVSADLGPFPKLNPEFVVRADPDLIIATRAAVRGLLTRPGWDAMRALRDGALCGFASERFEVLIRPGPRMAEAADSIVDCIAALPAAARN